MHAKPPTARVLKHRSLRRLGDRRRYAAKHVNVELEPTIADVLPTIESCGFSGSDDVYRIVTNDAVGVLDFQPSDSGVGYYVNVGVQPLFIPTTTEQTPDPAAVQTPECVFRSRIDPPDDLFQWPYSTDYYFSDALTDGITEKYATYISPLMTIPGPVTEATVNSFKNQRIHPLFGSAHPTTFLHLARIAVHFGRTDVARNWWIGH